MNHLQHSLVSMSVTPPRITSRMLAELPLFHGATAQSLEWAVDKLHVCSVDAGTILLTPDEPNSTAYIVLSGRLQVVLDTGDKDVHTFLEEGGCVGEMSIIEGAPPSATVLAASDSSLLAIDGHILWSLINRSHAVAKNLLFTLSERVRNDNIALVKSREQQRLHEHNARVDPLTNLGNRRWLAEMLPRQLERCTMDQQPLSVLMIDVDHFKRYNDTLGHLAGDSALRAVANIIDSSVRPTDSSARYGGEEFVVIMPETDADQATTIAQRLCDRIRDMSITHTDGRVLPKVTVSIGLADTGSSQEPVELLSQADAALYRAKESGRDRVSR